MRYVLVILLVGSAVIAFIFADHFPGFLAHYPRLQEVNWTVRSWLGMESPLSPHLSDGQLKETDRILRKESAAGKEITQQDLEEYRE